MSVVDAVRPSTNGNGSKAKPADPPQVEIDRIQSQRMSVPILGVTPLIINRFSEKAKQQMLNAAQGKRTPKAPKDPQAEYEGCFYHLDDEGYGFPADAFKQATVSAARFYNKKQLTMTQLNQFVFVHGLPSAKEGRALVPIVGEPTMREDVVKVGMSGTDLRYRPSFYPWSATLEITYFCSAITKETVLSLIDAGGLAVGVGDWRPEKKGTFGTYQIDPDRAVEVIG